jgi:hypothetical protein
MPSQLFPSNHVIKDANLNSDWRVIILNKWIKTTASAALASFILSAGTSAYAASPVYVNGHYQQSITTPKGKALVKLRASGWLR